MPKAKREYISGDQMHFIVTDDFVETANAFREYCEANSINTSGAIRMAISRWLRERGAKEMFVRQMETGDTLRTLAEIYEKEVLKEA